MQVQLRQVQDYLFRVSFDNEKIPDLLVDEPEPLGKGQGPNPSRLLAVSAANCLCASLLFCLRKSHLEPASISASATAETTRNERQRLRISALCVTIDVEGLDDPEGRFSRCAGLFEDFCVVTATLRQAMKVQVILRVNGEQYSVTE